MDNDRYLRILNQVKGESKLEKKLDDDVLIIDGLNTFIRCFSVNPSLNDDGEHIGGLVGFLKSLAYIVKTLKPTRCIVVFDGKGGSTRRRKWYPNYKNKKKTRFRLNRGNEHMTLDDERKSMRYQLVQLAKYLNNLPISVLSIDNIEADDTIAYISKQILKKSKITIMSTDKDFLQLIDDRINVWNPLRKKIYEPKDVLDEYGIPTHNFVLYRCLDGDKSDNVPGIKGIGLKRLIKKFDILLEDKSISVEDLLLFCEDRVSEGKIFQNIIDYKGRLELNYKLMQLHNVDISGNSKLNIKNIVLSNVNRIYEKEFKKMYMRDKLWSAIPNLQSWLSLSFGHLDEYVRNTDNE